MREIEAACLANLEETVVDPVLREKLRPNYRAACKRLIISPNFYESIQHPNAELVVSGIEAIEPTGVRMQTAYYMNWTCWCWRPVCAIALSGRRSCADVAV